MHRNIHLIAVSLLLAAGCSKKEKKEAEEAPAPVQVTAVTQDTIRRIVSGDGVLYARDQASVMPKISAPVLRFYVSRGDHVKQGQLLATLENRDLTAAVAESKGLVDQAEANYRSTSAATVPEAVIKAQTDVQSARQMLEAAQKLLDNRRKLFQEGALARRQVDEAEVSYAQAKGQFESAQEHLRALQNVGKQEQIKGAAAQVETAKAHYQSSAAQAGYSEIRSPISGVIADRPLYAGEMASAGAPLLTVLDISRVVAHVNVPQVQAGTVKVGQTAVMTVNDVGDEVNGKVIVVSPATDPNSTTVQVWVQIENPGEQLKPGASVHANIATEIYKAATVVPETAILPGEEGGTAVLTVSSDMVAHRKKVEVGVREGKKVQILRGVQPGEEVVVVGGMGLDDKAKVKIVDTTVKEPEEEEEPSGKEEKKDEAKPKAK